MHPTSAPGIAAVRSVAAGFVPAANEALLITAHRFSDRSTPPLLAAHRPADLFRSAETFRSRIVSLGAFRDKLDSEIEKSGPFFNGKTTGGAVIVPLFSTNT